MEMNFNYQRFNVEKAIIFLSEKEQANILCRNKGWNIVGKFYVKFETWSLTNHAYAKLIPSYGGWTKFSGIPQHMWNSDTLNQIGNAYG